MSLKDHFRKIVSQILEKFLAVPELSNKSIGDPQRILIIRQHNQFGDLLASVSLFRAIKETFPDSHLTLIASPENYYAVVKNEFIDELFIYDRKKFINPSYISKVKNILHNNYDLALVPVTVAVSITSCILAGFSKAKIKIGPNSLNGDKNNLAFVFNYKIDMDWSKCPDAHVSDFILDLVRPFGIKTKNYNSSISFDDFDRNESDKFLNSFLPEEHNILIGFHVGAGKEQNRWSLKKYVELIKLIQSNHKLKFYFTGSSADSEELSYMKKHFDDSCGYYLNKSIPQLAALISKSDYFITNDTGVMHVAGATTTPQISIFGPTNPFNWAPIGDEKYFIRKSELIDDVSVEDVYNLFELILKKK
ncbi:MAG: glycosyltransferase family 9 protein [Ignavibacteriales bacterium]|nr:glycosyltransferase family 9 protein [Ignavibacteriales bacterium]